MSLGPITYYTKKYEQISKDCLCGLVEMKEDYKVRGLVFKSKREQNLKTNLERVVKARVRGVGTCMKSWYMCRVGLESYGGRGVHVILFNNTHP